MAQIEEMVFQTVKDYEGLRQIGNRKARSLRIPSIRFHPGANLVIVIGEPDAVAVAAKVIGALPGAKRSVATDAPGSDDPSRKVEEAIKKLQRDGVIPAPRQ
jgi:hypothetical protein